MTVANSISLRGRSILITGGSRGLGSEMAQALVEAGADVMISGRRHSSALSNTYNKLKKIAKGLEGKPKIYKCVANLTDNHACETLVLNAIKSFGKLDVLINNAGGAPLADSISASPKFHQAIIDLNLMAPLNLSQKVAKVMMRHRQSSI